MNNGSWLPEEDFPGLSDDLFDDFIKYIDFPLEDVANANDEGDWDAGFQGLEPPPLDMFSGLSSEFSCGGFNNGSRVGAQKTLPISKHSSSSEASSGSFHKSSSPDLKVAKLFQSSSPVSVLENSNSSLSSETFRSHGLVFPVKGIRSKRKRPTALKLRILPFESPRKSQPSISEDSESETYYPYEKTTKKKRKKHWIRPTHLSSSFSESKSSSEGTIRKCTHCETTKTPQWREGPNGPKTLCNACGVRYRSGRLVPEYRPAASPTFTPSLHSNSHRKIIEMRRKSDQEFDTGVIHTVTSRA